jgi:GntR family transcriptional regulator
VGEPHRREGSGPRTYYDEDRQPVKTAEIVVPAATREIVYEVPVNP